MTNNHAHPQMTQYNASKLLLFTIIVVLFVVFFIIEHNIYFTTQFSGFNLSDAETNVITSGNSQKQLMMLFLFLFSIIFLINKENYTYIFRDSIGRLILANVFWATISIFWADDPALVGRRIVLFLIINITAFSISMNVPLRQFPIILLGITAPILVIGFLSERVLHTWWFGDPDYRFSGTLHPEGQAINCAMLFLAAATMTRRGGFFSRAMYLSVMVVAAIFLILTKSRGPFVGTIIAFGIYKLSTKKRSTLVIYLFMIFVALGMMVLVLGDTLLPLLGSGINLGRQESVGELSGRAELWNQLGDFVKEHPMLGHGLGGFWTEDRVLIVSDALRWRVTDSHSIYMETILDLGFIGLGIILALLIVACLRAWRMSVNWGDEGAAFALSFLTLYMADGLFSSLVLGRGFNTLLLLIVLLGIARKTQLKRSQEVVTNQ